MKGASLRSVLAFWGFVVSFSLISLLHAAPLNDAKDKNTVNIAIGIYAPFTSPRAFIGRNILSAMEMAQDKLPHAKVHYSFFTLDKLPNNSNPTNLLQKFVETHHLNVLVTEGSVNGECLAAFARKNDLIHFSMASDPAIADGKNNFLMWSPAYEQAAVLVDTLKQKKIKQLGIITSNQASDRVLTQSVMQQLRTDSAIEIATYERYEAGTQNFSKLINKIKGNNADLYFIMASPKDIELIQAQMKQAQIDKPITSIVERVTPQVIKIFNDQWYIDTHEMKPEFINQYLEENKNYPATEAGYAYDIFQILNQSVLMAMNAKSNFSTQDLAEHIHTLALGTGVMGPFNLDKKGILYTQSAVRTVHQGQVHTA